MFTPGMFKTFKEFWKAKKFSIELQWFMFVVPLGPEYWEYNLRTSLENTWGPFYSDKLEIPCFLVYKMVKTVLQYVLFFISCSYKLFIVYTFCFKNTSISLWRRQIYPKKHQRVVSILYNQFQTRFMCSY